jgi:hypothetical protein
VVLSAERMLCAARVALRQVGAQSHCNLTEFDVTGKHFVLTKMCVRGTFAKVRTIGNNELAMLI